MSKLSPKRPSWLQRYILPGLAFKAVVIGGGYATGRELAEFFLPSGPLGGLLAMLVATMVWSVICALTFSYAQRYQLTDYRAFFGKLLGRAWFLFELTYFALVLLMLSVFAAASGAIGQALFGWPSVAGAGLLLVAIAAFVAIGLSAVEPLFKYVSVLLYGTYAGFLMLSLWKFGPAISRNLQAHDIGPSWLAGGITYAGYNVVAAVIVLPVLRHLHSQRDALVAGIIAGPLAMAPGLFFFLSMIAWYPMVGQSTLPSDFLLIRIGVPSMRLLFQAMIFLALLESGVGAVFAVMQRVRHALLERTGRDPNPWLRGMITLLVLFVAVFAAQGVGLIDLIAKGYRLISWMLIAVFVVPILFVSMRRLGFIHENAS